MDNVKNTLKVCFKKKYWFVPNYEKNPLGICVWFLLEVHHVLLFIFIFIYFSLRIEIHTIKKTVLKSKHPF